MSGPAPARRLDPGWVAAVPAMFRSAADSIERRRVRLVGDPPALLAAAGVLRTEAGRTDSSWRQLERHRDTLAGVWHGEAADRAETRLAVVEGQLSGASSSMTFAAEGLELAAVRVGAAEDRGNAAVLDYLRTMLALDAWWRALPIADRATALPEYLDRGTAAGAAALQRVYREEVALDAFLASLPRRFVYGPSAPWRSTLRPMVDESRASAFSAALTVFGVRGTRDEGTVAIFRQDGKVIVSLNDGYALGPHTSAGAKVSFDKVPAKVKGMLSRAYGEVEGAVVTGYSRRFAFDNESEAQHFLQQLSGRGPWESAGAALRDGLGFLAGPVADFGPWQSDHLGREPEERTFSLGAKANANADAGLWPVAGVSAKGSYDEAATLTLRANNESTLTSTSSVGAKVGGTLLGWSEVGGEEIGTTRRVDFDSTGEPVRYVVQRSVTGDYDYQLGTNNTYVGIGGPVPGGVLPDGVHVKVDGETAAQKLESYVLDLRQPENRAVFDRALQLAPAEAVPVPSEENGLHRHLLERSTMVQQAYEPERTSGQASATVGLGPATFSAKAGPVQEVSRLTEAWYVHLGEPDARDAAGHLRFRPMPRDPRGRPGSGGELPPQQDVSPVGAD